MDFSEITKKLWCTYFSAISIHDYTLSGFFAPDCVIIGTGRHEFYHTTEDFCMALEKEIVERQNTDFQIDQFQCQENRLAPGVVLVYGSFLVWWVNAETNIRLHMDSRFSFLYKNTDTGWKIVHIHHSLPNLEQRDGEAYPKTLTEQFLREKEKVEFLSLLAQKDGLTDLINYRTFEKLYPKSIKNGTWFLVADLDCFKNINDTCGHIEGNRILKETARILKSSVRSNDLVCRMGGDEFVLLCSGLPSQKEAEFLLHRILTNISCLHIRDAGSVSLSIGATAVQQNESLEIVFQRADQALYEIKAKGRNGWKIR